MRKYQSDNKNYNAILDAMAEIRHNQLNENYMYEGEHEDEEMEEVHGGDHMDDEEAEAIAEMMDEALYEMDMEDDEDNLTEADGDRKQRRRNRLRQALLIGAGLAAAGLGAAAGSKFVAQGKLGGALGVPAGFGQETARALRGAVGGAIDSAGRSAASLAPDTYRSMVRDPATKAMVDAGLKGRRSEPFRATGDVMTGGTRLKGGSQAADAYMRAGASAIDAMRKRGGAADF